MLNKAVLMGRLTNNPELRHTTSNIAVTTFSLAVGRNYTRQGAEQQTDFIDIVCWRHTAEFVSKYFSKGQLVAVSGMIQTRNWKDSNGNNRKSVEVVADEVYFAEPKRDSSGSGNNSSRNEDNFAFPSDDSSFSTGGPDDFEEVVSDDDLPF